MYTVALHVALHQGANGSSVHSIEASVGSVRMLSGGGEDGGGRPPHTKRGIFNGDRTELAVSAQGPVHVWRILRVVSAQWLCRLLTGLSPSLSARLFEWISSFTKADSGDDHVPLYPKGSQAPSSQ